jgi:hypothetical protein
MVFRKAVLLCVIHKEPKSNSVAHLGDILYSKIHATNVELPIVPIG